MPRPFLRARATILSALLGLGLGSAAQAADLFGLPDAPALPEEPVEWGSNWYLRGDIGWQHVDAPAFSGDFASMLNTADIASGGLGAGYQFNDWVRADVTVDRSVFRRSGTIGQIWCPYQAVGLYRTDATGASVPVGVFANPNDTCSRAATATLVRTSLLANAYVDLGHFWGFTPYVGAGVGMTYNSSSSSISYFRNSDGALWGPDLTLPSGQVPQWIYVNGATYPVQIPFGPTNWSTWQTRSAWRFAWNVMAGVSYDVAENLKVDLGYRFLNAGKYTGLASWGSSVAPVSKDITSHEVRVGVRVTTN
ncbi:MAG: outer membrane protein [Methylocystis sp.]|uniref:outer membrane protein n=1 Tax=Methylocystis sp. TaxID=1911079 RepID=UPI003DA3FE53